MINVMYVGSSGNAYNLQLKNNIRIREANFHEYEWGYEATERRFGVAIDRFVKAPVVYEIEFTLYGGHDIRRDNIVELHNDFEHDIVTKSPGRLIWGDCYIDGYVIQSATYPESESNFRTTNKISFFAPHPFWIQERSISIDPIDSSIIRETDKKYSYQYPYSYTQDPRTSWISLNYYSDCDVRIIAYGPFSSVYVTINKNVYNVAYPADESEYMVIDSRAVGTLKGQAYLVRANGTKVNVFDYRNPLYQLFAKVEAGGAQITYPRTYGIDVTFFMERSEPIINADGEDLATLINKEGLPLAVKV